MKKSIRYRTSHLIEDQFEPGSRGRVLKNKLGITSARAMAKREKEAQLRAREMKEPSLPIIHIIGLPGAGKTTLGKKLSKKYGLPVLYIGTYRAKFPATDEGEADAWVALFRDLSRQKWGNCILETTRLNSRESFLRAAFPFSKIVTIKLIAQRKVLYKRIQMKKKSEQGGDWLFSDHYSDKYEFVRKMFKYIKEIPAEIVIDTTNRSVQDVFKKAVSDLTFWIR